MPAQDRILQYLMQNLAQGGETTPQSIREYPTARSIPGVSRSDIVEYPTGPVLPPDSRAKILQMLGNNIAPTGSSNPGVARALQGGVGNPAGAVPSPTFEFADQYAKQQMPPITPNYQAYQNPRDRYSDVVNAVRQHAMQLGGAGGNAGNRMGFVEGETGKNALRGLAAVGQTLAQAMMMKQMMDPGRQYYQPSSGRIISSNPNAMSPAEGMQMMMRERQLNYENDLAAMKTQSELMSKLAELEATGEQGYESNARGNAVWDETMRERAKLAPAIYQDITAGQENESQTQYNYNKDAREQKLLPLEEAVKQSQAAQNLAGARSNNATAAKTEYGLERDRIDKPIETDTNKYKRDTAGQEAKFAPTKYEGDALKSAAEGKMAQEESKLPPDKRKGSNRIPMDEYSRRKMLDSKAAALKELILQRDAQYSKDMGGDKDSQTAKKKAEKIQGRIDMLQQEIEQLGGDPTMTTSADDGADTGGDGVSAIADAIKMKRPGISDQEAQTLARAYLAKKKQ